METKNTIEINLKEVQAVDLMGNQVPILNLHEQICNIIFKNTGSIRVGDTVRELYYGRSVEADEQVLNELIVECNGCFKPMVQQAVLTYLMTKLNSLKQEEKAD